MNSNIQASKHVLAVYFALKKSANAPVKKSPCRGLCLNALK